MEFKHDIEVIYLHVVLIMNKVFCQVHLWPRYRDIRYVWSCFRCFKYLKSVITFWVIWPPFLSKHGCMAHAVSALPLTTVKS